MGGTTTFSLVSGKLYIIGGFDDDKVRYDNRLLSMDIDTGETLTLTPMANARTNPGVATSESQLFVFGGYIIYSIAFK